MSALARLPISFAVAGGETTHAPTIVLRLGGRDRRLVLDTGSEVHLITEDLAVELRLEMRPGEQGTDHSGATMASWSVDDVPVQLGQVAAMLVDVVAIAAPPAFRERGIDGILSPQKLHPTAYAVIDLDTQELVMVDATDDEAAAFLLARKPAWTLLRLRRDAAFSSVVVEAAVDGFEPIPTMLNTGGRRTEFSAVAVPGLTRAAAKRLGGGVAGSDYAGWFVGPRTLAVGGIRLPIPALAVRDVMHDPQGLVGMDVLRGTVLACASDMNRPVFWVVPP